MARYIWRKCLNSVLNPKRLKYVLEADLFLAKKTQLCIARTVFLNCIYNIASKGTFLDVFFP